MMAVSERTKLIREQQRSGSGEVTAVMVSARGRIDGFVRDDIWTIFPNVHLRVLDAEKGGIEIQICDCGMSGNHEPQGWARIEKHNRNRLADAIRLSPQQQEWMPISSTPKDSSWILGLMRTGRQAVIRWGGGTWEDDNRLCRDPYRWQPLPPPPMQGEK